MDSLTDLSFRLSVSLDPLWGQFKNIPEDDLKFIQYSNASALEEAIMSWTNSRSLEFGTWRQHHGGFEFYNVNYTTNSYGFYLPVNVSETTTLPTLINLFNNALLSKMLSDGGVDGNVALLNMTDHPLDSTGYVGWGISIADPTQNIGNILYFIVAFFFGFCIIGGILGKAIVVDKEFQIRLQMNLMGVDKPTYWFSNYLVDVIMIFIAGSIMAGIAAAFESKFKISLYDVILRPSNSPTFPFTCRIASLFRRVSFINLGIRRIKLHYWLVVQQVRRLSQYVIR